MMLQVRVSPEKSVKIGEEVWLSVATEKIHLFDRVTGLALKVQQLSTD